MKIAVITPTLREREVLLAECKESVRQQDIKEPVEHYVGVDDDRLGCGITRNRLVAGLNSSFDWLAFLDDDDLFLPNHLRILSEARETADIIYSDCETVGWKKTWVTRAFDYQALLERNYISATVLMRREVFEKVGGFRRCFAEDWDLWKRCAQAGMRFCYIPQVTWLYRQVEGFNRMLGRMP